MSVTHLYTDERTFWHSTGVQALVMPVGGWVEPPSGGGPADTPASKRRILNLVRASGLDARLDTRSAEPASRDQMLEIHPAVYLDEFKAVSDAGGGDIGDYAPFSQGGYEIAALSAGLAIAAVDAVVSGAAPNAYALCRPAGHHCRRERSMGFCLLANIPIAIEAARARHPLGRVVVVDWDVHHGNGTQEIYYDRDDVLTISLHQENCFPPGYSGLEDRGEGKGSGYNVNIPLPSGCGHDAYLRAVEQIVVPAIEDYRPDLIIVASGLDASAVDPLARMLLHSESYRAMTKRMMDLAERLCGGRLVIVHEGGYAEAYTPFCGQAILEVLTGAEPIEDPFLGIFHAQQPSARTSEALFQIVDEMTEKLRK